MFTNNTGAMDRMSIFYTGLIFLVVLTFFGLSVWGLFNRGRSVLIAGAGVVVLLGAALGVLHAWGEGRSIPWTVIYTVIGLIGLVATLRQVLPRKKQPAAKTEPSAADGN